MGRILYAYAGFTPAQLKGRASIPSQADIAVGANYIDCSSVDAATEIRDVIGESSNDFGTIYLSAKVNKWSNFGPREWYLSGGVLYDRAKSNPYDMSNFCGYNHEAVAPYINSFTDIWHQNVENGIDVTAYISEIDWSLIGGIVGMGITSKVGGITYKTSYALFSVMDWRRLLIIQSQFTMPYISNQTVVNEVFFIDSGNNRIANIPNIGTFNTLFIAAIISMSWGNSNLAYQAKTIVTPAAEWTVVSHPSWIDHVVYRNGVMVSGTNPYISGDELRLYPSDVNTGGNRNGYVELSEGIEIETFQYGHNPKLLGYDSGGIVLSSATATLNVDAETVPISFHINSGLSASNVTIYYRLFCNTTGVYMGEWQSAFTRNGQTVNGTLGPLISSDLDYGRDYTVYVTTVDPML